MVVGDNFNHGLYHALIPIQNLPFLNSEPADVMWLVSVSDVMTRNVKCLGKQVQMGQVARLLERSATGELTHQAFPVVDSDQEGHRKLRGIISLTQLQRAFSDSKKRSEAGSRRTLSSADAEKLSIIHLLDYADRSPITTVPHAKVARAFEVFRKLGMRHLCVADSDNFLVGILTRKDFMTYRLAENIKRYKAESLIRGWVCRWRKRRELRMQLQAIEAQAQTTGSVGGMYGLHVRRVGEEGWDGTLDGRGTYEEPAKLESLFSQYGRVAKVSKVRHRIQDGKNTSWAIVMMETAEGMNAAIEGTIMVGETKLQVAPFSPKVALASTGAASSIVQTLELSQLLAAVGVGNP
jgi:CBS domain-containing protein